VLYSLLYDLLRLLIEILIVRGSGDARLRAEVLALRHQLGVLERQVGRPLWRPDDRLLLSAISEALPRSEWGIATAQPGDAAALASGAGAAEVGRLQTTAASATTVPNRRTRG
jgi:hypothetical protein